NNTVSNKGKIVDMEIRPFESDKDFESIKNWASDERTHSMWCANRFMYPLEKEDFSQALKGVYERCGDLAYVAVANDTPVGFFCYSFNCDTREGMLKFVIVEPFYRGKGVAKEMFDHILQHAFNETDAEAVQLMVFQQNLRAKRFYEKMGFKERRTVTEAFLFKDESWDRCNMVVKKKHVVVHS
nr:GNAT family N-acetyltransferase [Lachnospiraceae bacterium]